MLGQAIGGLLPSAVAVALGWVAGIEWFKVESLDSITAARAAALGAALPDRGPAGRDLTLP